ncbi:MAG: HEAT repeat domain-containing protein [Pirellulales bacterium]
MIANLVEIGAPAVRSLTRALRYNDAFGARALDALIRIGTPSVLPLIEVLSDSEYGPLSRLLHRHLKQRGFCEAVATALGEIGDRRATKPLCCLLDDDSAPSVRSAILQALIKIGAKHRDQLSMIHDALAMAECDGARDALEAIEQYATEYGTIVRRHMDDGTAALRPLIAKLTCKDISVRDAAIEALGSMSDPEIVRPLVQLWHDTVLVSRPPSGWRLYLFERRTRPPYETTMRRTVGALTSEETIPVRLGQSVPTHVVDALIAPLSKHRAGGPLWDSALRILAGIGSAVAIDPILDSLDSLEWRSESDGYWESDYRRTAAHLQQIAAWPVDTLVKIMEKDASGAKRATLERLVQRSWRVPITCRYISDSHEADAEHKADTEIDGQSLQRLAMLELQRRDS